MQAATNDHGLTIINFGIGSPNAATIMDLLTAYHPEAVLFLGKCGGLKHTTEIGHFILPIGAIRGEGTSDDYLPPLVPALPSFKLHKFVSQKLVDRGLEYRTGVIYTTNRRVWEHDVHFREQLEEYTPIAIDMETATIFVVGHKNQIARGALLLVSDKPLTPEGVKTRERDARDTRDSTERPRRASGRETPSPTQVFRLRTMAPPRLRPLVCRSSRPARSRGFSLFRTPLSLICPGSWGCPTCLWNLSIFHAETLATSQLPGTIRVSQPDLGRSLSVPA
jgi:nucleoside phosphorylase